MILNLSDASTQTGFLQVENKAKVIYSLLGSLDRSEFHFIM